MNDLVESIKVYQAVNGVNDSQFSNLIGVDPSTWSKIKNHERKPGVKFFRGLSRIPELKKAIANYMAGDIGLLIIPGVPERHHDSKWEAFWDYCDGIYQRALDVIYDWAKRG